MTGADILARVDHTLLSATATEADIENLCREALDCRAAAVCIPPCYVARARQKFPALNIATVIGFPLGYDSTAAKVAGARQAIADGADEVDMVINLTALKNRDFDCVTAEIKAVKQAVGDKVLKVIIEACYLTDAEKIQAARCVTDGNADYIKTSTGFGTGGATHEDVKLLAAHIGSGVKIKAAGGISTVEDMKRYIAAGCQRLGASRAVKLLKDRVNKEV